MTIKDKQWQLYYLGYYGTTEKDVDGIWGKNSRKATIEFQSSYGLSPDGVFGAKTIAKSKEVISKIHEVIGSLITPPLPKSAYGLAGTKTIKATQAYQTKNGLKVTGRADKETLTHINKSVSAVQQSTSAKAPETVVAVVSPTNTSTSNVDKLMSTGTWWDDIKYFDRSEFGCKCNRYCNKFPVEPVKEMVMACDKVREHFGATMKVTSGIRCKTHNANEGGVSNSRHMYGKAVDFYVVGKTADQVLVFVKTLPEIRYCYKINDRCVHMDVQ